MKIIKLEFPKFCYEIFFLCLKQIYRCLTFSVCIYSNITVNQTYLVTFIKVGCVTGNLFASSGPKAEGVPTNSQKGRGSGPCRL